MIRRVVAPASARSVALTQITKRGHYDGFPYPPRQSRVDFRVTPRSSKSRIMEGAQGNVPVSH
ncbi:hypothetical protein QFZ94_008816 [Paraburkholderia sp. JPY465]